MIDEILNSIPTTNPKRNLADRTQNTQAKIPRTHLQFLRLCKNLTVVSHREQGYSQDDFQLGEMSTGTRMMTSSERHPRTLGSSHGEFWTSCFLRVVQEATGPEFFHGVGFTRATAPYTRTHMARG